ncbi:hypothetical protein HHK36_000235 [Tetracentron sinense]|uniref:C2 NT-type domain-containing protein n=1 Tax=Tetracentron sinense TaxID=13715 RepID=A0A834ZQR1_TETSI|nr:hypothetical protein HHK36_000235 [Tetracentron sinense]
MFKSARWRSEKNKIKVIFRLQFQATQVPQLGGDSLTISLVPLDVGKPTVRLEKAAVRDGTCRWEKPIYETVKFVREPRTGTINEKTYQFIVSTGSSKAGLLGEVTIDFADYAEAIKPSSVSLPLKTSNSSAVLHVTIQKMQEAVDQREVEEIGDVPFNSQDRSLKSQLRNSDTNGSSNCDSTEDENTASGNAESNGNLRASTGSDATSASGSESSSGRNTRHEFGLRNNKIHQDPSSFLASLSHSSMPQKEMANATTTNNQEHRRSNTECSVGSAPDGSIGDLTNSSEEHLLRERSQHASDALIEKLKSDLVVLERQAEVSELELHTLRKQIVKESKRGQDLSREVVILKVEREAVKREFEQLKTKHKHIDAAKASNKLQFETEDPKALLEEIKQELNYEKDLNANFRLQLQKTQESNSELIITVQDLEEMLEQKNKEIFNIRSKVTNRENAEEVLETVPKHEIDEDKEQQALEEIVKEQNDAKDANLLEQKITDLNSEIEVYRRDREELEVQMEQLALDYEILKQENHDISLQLEQSQLHVQLKMQYECSAYLVAINELEIQVEYLEKELRKQAHEFSASLASIDELETQVNNLEKELEKQAQGFEADLESVSCAKVEQEQRAIRAEEALRKTRWYNANTAEQLQEECRMLSVQMESTFDANEKLTMKAMTEASELRLQKIHLEEMLEKADEELGSVKDQYEAKLQELSNQVDLKTKQIEQMLLEIEDKSKQLQHQKRHEEERHEFLSKEIMLRAEIERLIREKKQLSEQSEQEEKLRAEMEQLKTSIDETEMLVHRGNMERHGLEKRIASMREEAEKSLEELNNMRCVKDEKETMVGILQKEVETLKSRYNDLKHSLFEDEFEKENLRKQVFHLRGELKKKEDTITNMEKKLMDSSGGDTVSDVRKPTSRNNRSTPVLRGSKEVNNLRDKIKLLEGQIKLKEAALENSANSFLEKEKDLCNKIEEIQCRMEDLNQNSTSFCQDQFLKEATDGEKITENDSKIKGRNIAENLLDSGMSNKACISDQDGTGTAPIKSNNETCSEKELNVTMVHASDQDNLVELLNEIVLLKDRNESMEGELREMQERYSEISLKFAEVEGERQKLVMSVRNLKNAKKK